MGIGYAVRNMLPDGGDEEPVLDLLVKRKPEYGLEEIESSFEDDGVKVEYTLGDGRVYRLSHDTPEAALNVYNFLESPLEDLNNFTDDYTLAALTTEEAQEKIYDLVEHLIENGELNSNIDLDMQPESDEFMEEFCRNIANREAVKLVEPDDLEMEELEAYFDLSLNHSDIPR